MSNEEPPFNSRATIEVGASLGRLRKRHLWASLTVALTLVALLVAGACGKPESSDRSSAIGDEPWRAAGNEIVSAGFADTVGVRADGTAVAVGGDPDGQLDVASWSGLVAVSAGDNHTVGLRADGTAVAAGNNDYGQCDVSSWSDLVAVSAGGLHTVGLRADGTAVATGYRKSGRCNVGSWKDLTAVSAGGYHTVGLRADGTAVAVGTNDDRCNVGSWKDLTAVSAGGGHTVGLRADGTAVAVGTIEGGQCDVASWQDLVSVSAGFEHTVGLRVDGSVVAVGDPRFGQCNVSSWTLATPPPPGGVSGSLSPAPPPSPPVSASTGSGGPPPVVSVYLLDGSGARESTVSNASWASQIEMLGGPRVQARNLGVRNQTFLQDAMLDDALPPEKALTLIGLSVGRFTGDPREGLAGYDPGAVLASTAEVQHLYSVSDVLPDKVKRRRLEHWLTEDAPVFDETRGANVVALEQLVKECLARGQRPVLLELPLNVDIVGDDLDEQRAAYRAGARKLAARYGIPYLDFVEDVGLTSGDFFDLVHLVEPGRLKWQRRLSTEVVALLEEYGMGQR